ncbi:23113_t:CDS:2 [Dentiscutata erythropus]|uniref:23113_t:CDS:1 n=1 Tax=Dentiscutata erythropus TaxID=1348616 RepID=A0A9N9D013_9GLOM|nr:23113_t:CDS:2 [Dentiscutata erythropus]
MGKLCSQNQTTCCYCGDIVVTKKDRTCQEIKLYEFANLELQKLQYISVDPDSDLQLKINNELHNQEKFHCFIYIKENIDLELLQQLLD